MREVISSCDVLGHFVFSFSALMVTTVPPQTCSLTLRNPASGACSMSSQVNKADSPVQNVCYACSVDSNVSLLLYNAVPYLTHTHTHHTHAQTYTHTHTYIQAHTHTHTQTHTQAHTHTHTYTHRGTDRPTHTHKQYTYTLTHTHRHTHTHTHTQTTYIHTHTH